MLADETKMSRRKLRQQEKEVKDAMYEAGRHIMLSVIHGRGVLESRETNEGKVLNRGSWRSREPTLVCWRDDSFRASRCKRWKVEMC